MVLLPDPGIPISTIFEGVLNISVHYASRPKDQINNNESQEQFLQRAAFAFINS